MNQKEIAAMTEAVIGSLESLYHESGAEIPDLLEGIKIQVNSQIQRAWCNALPSGEARRTYSSAEKLKAALLQEQRLTKHLDGVLFHKNERIGVLETRVAGLEEELEGQALHQAGMAGTIQGQRRRIQLLDAEVGRMELAVNNLTEKNDNQFNIIEDMKQVARGFADELAAVDQKNTKAGRQLLAKDTEIVRLTEQRDLAVEARDAHWNAVVDLSEKMVSKSWGSDEDLEVLERINVRINTASAELDSQLDHIRTQR